MPRDAAQTPTATLTVTSTATATATAAPIVQDDFVGRTLAWPEDQTDVYVRGYVDDGYRLLVKRGPYYTTSLVDVHAADWTMFVDLRLTGTNGVPSAGIAFGSVGSSCSASLVDCYRFYLSTNGEVALIYQAQSGSSQVYASTTQPLNIGQTYRLRLDRSGTHLNAWLSSDLGQSWRPVMQSPASVTAGRGSWLGFAAAAVIDDVGSADAYFDNFVVWRANEVPLP